jgi:hypothetical protein
MSSPVIGGRWEDQQLNAVASGSGATPAAKAAYRGELELFEFTASGTDQIGGELELSHSYQEGTSLVLHVHWCTNSTNAAGGDVVWAYEYSLANPADGSAETYSGFANVTQTVAAGNRQYLTNSFDIATIANVGGTVSTLFGFNLKRIGSSGSDTYPVSVFLKSVALHIKLDTVGSNGQNSKN